MNDSPVNRSRRPVSNALHPGLIILVIGIFFLLSNFGVFHLSIAQLWPVILIAIGLINILKGRMDSVAVGIALMIFGGGFLLANYGKLPFAAWKLWPVFVIAAGFQILWAAMAWKGKTQSCGFGQASWRDDWPKWPGPGTAAPPRQPALGAPGSSTSAGSASSGSASPSAGPVPPRSGTYSGEPETWMHMMAIFAETRRRVVSPALVHGEAWSVFGNCVVDLRPMGVPDHAVTIDANSVFGAVEIHVPSNWDVTLRGTGMFGAFENKMLPSPGEPRGHLIVTGVAAFGAVTVMN